MGRRKYRELADRRRRIGGKMKTDRELLEEQRRRKEWRKDQAAFDAAIAGTSRNDDKGER